MTSTKKHSLDIYKNYYGSPFSLEGYDGEGLSWRNVHGQPVIGVSPLSPELFDSVLDAGLDPPSALCYRRPYAGLYEIIVDDASYDNYRSAYETIYSALLDEPLEDSTLSISWYPSQQEAVQSAQEIAPIKVSVVSKSIYDLLSPAIDRLAIAIDILDGAINDQIVPGFGITFNRGLTKTNKAHIAVGGTYIEDEDRYYKGTIFGTVPVEANSFPTEITIKNISGENLIGLTAKVINRYAVKQVIHNRPFPYIDQAGVLNKAIISPFESILVQFEDTASALTKIKADGEFYAIRAYPESALFDADTIETESVLSCNALTKYMFAEDTPLAGLMFTLHPDLDNDDCALVYTVNGEGVFEISLDENIWETSEIDVADSLADDATTTVNVRTRPASALVSSDAYGTDAYLRIMGAYENQTGPLSIVTKTLSSSGSLSHKAIRLVLPALSYKADAIRVKFKAGSGLNRLKIDEAYFGTRVSESADFETTPTKGQLTFSGSESLELTEDGEQWSDWLNFMIAGNTEHIIAYHGPLVGCVTNETGSAYTLDQAGDSVSDVVAGYTEASTWFDVVEVQVKVQDYVISLIPLTATVPENIPGATVDAWIINSDIASVLDEYGITMESA